MAGLSELLRIQKNSPVRQGEVVTLLAGGRAIVHLGRSNVIVRSAANVAVGQAVTVNRVANAWHVVGAGGQRPGETSLEVTIDG